MNITRAGTQASSRGPAEYFTGTVRIDPLFQAPDPGRAVAAFSLSPTWMAMGIANAAVAILAGLALAAFVASARADTPAPATFKAHGVTFTYPGSWMELPVSYEVKIGTPLWLESIGPAPTLPPTTDPPPPPSDTPQPATPALNIVTLAAYHVNVVLTSKNIGRYKKYFAASFAQLAAAVQGQVEGGPTRINLGKLPGYGFRMSAQAADGTVLEDRVLFAFRQKTEYFFSCQHPQTDPLAAEVEGGCAQIIHSFRLAK